MEIKTSDPRLRVQGNSWIETHSPMSFGVGSSPTAQGISSLWVFSVYVSLPSAFSNSFPFSYFLFSLFPFSSLYISSQLQFFSNVSVVSFSAFPQLCLPYLSFHYLFLFQFLFISYSLSLSLLSIDIYPT